VGAPLFNVFEILFQTRGGAPTRGNWIFFLVGEPSPGGSSFDSVRNAFHFLGLKPYFYILNTNTCKSLFKTQWIYPGYFSVS